MYRFRQMIIDGLDLKKGWKTLVWKLVKNMKITTFQFSNRKSFLRKNCFKNLRFNFTFNFEQYLEGLPPLQGRGTLLVHEQKIQNYFKIERNFRTFFFAKALFTQDILTRNIAIKRYCNNNIFLSHGYLMVKVSYY
jgi:hypothetical protein